MPDDKEPTIKDVLSFLYEHMPTKAEINERFNQMPTREDFNSLQASVDNLTKNTLDYQTEVLSLRQKVKDMEDWIKTASSQLGIQYKP